MEKVRSDGWTPVLSDDGTVYCSPRCGHKCSKMAFDVATRNCAALAARMGDGWKPHVWENSGWHYRVEKGPAKIYCHPSMTSDRYAAWIEFEGIGDRGSVLQFIVNADTPEDALGIATQQANGTIAQIRAGLDALLSGENDRG
ncbi:hypothetical protein CD928_05765 [Sphingopyxis sp. GW247-27LB]|nr:hypothetical protein CD928_05765 [Sphingopyxis sp. GW247-27LB]